MNRNDWQNAFGRPDDEFRLHLRQTLDGLEEKDMKKRYKISTVLIAAVIIVAMLAGAGIAASRLGVFRLLEYADPIVPLQGAEELVATNLGTSENEYAILTVEEAVFDGQGVLVKCRMTPKDNEGYVLFDDFMQDASEDDYIRQSVPVKVPLGEQTSETEKGVQTVINGGERVSETEGGAQLIADGGGVQKLLLNGEEIEIPSSREEALEKGLIVYRMDSELYYADFEEFQVLGRKDGRELMGYDLSSFVQDNLIFMDMSDAQGQEDGGVIWWDSGVADDVLDVDEIRMRVSAKVYIDGEVIPLDEISFTLPKSEEERRYVFTPAGDAFGERFEILNGSMVCTKVRGYLKIDYRYQQAEAGEEMGIDFRIYDADGQRINTGSGSCHEENGVYHWNMEMQSFAEIPETIFLEAKVIGEDKTLGRVECKLIEE